MSVCVFVRRRSGPPLAWLRFLCLSQFFCMISNISCQLGCTMPLLSVQRVRYPFEEQVRVLWSIVLSEICRNIKVHFERVFLNACNFVYALYRFRPSIVKDIITAVTSPGASAHASSSFRLLLNLSRLSPSFPCPFSSFIFSRTLVFILSAPASLPLAQEAISVALSLPLPLACSSVSMFVAAVVAAEGLIKAKSIAPAPEYETVASSGAFSRLNDLSLLLKNPPSSPLITHSLFISSLSRALCSQNHFLNRNCTSQIAASMAVALKSLNPLHVARVTGDTCHHLRSQCKGVCEWALTMRVSSQRHLMKQ